MGRDGGGPGSGDAGGRCAGAMAAGRAGCAAAATGLPLLRTITTAKAAGAGAPTQSRRGSRARWAPGAALDRSQSQGHAGFPPAACTASAGAAPGPSPRLRSRLGRRRPAGLPLPLPSDPPFPAGGPRPLTGPLSFPPLPGGGPPAAYGPPLLPGFTSLTRAAARLLKGGLHTYIHTHTLSFPGWCVGVYCVF